MFVRRDRHEARLEEFQVCRDEHLDTAHDVARVVYFGSLFASVFIGGALAPLYLLTSFTAGTVYGSVSDSVARKNMQVSGENRLSVEVIEPSGLVVAFEFAERMLPVLMIGL